MMKKICYILILILVFFVQLYSAETLHSFNVHHLKKEFHKTISIEKPIPLRVSHSLGNIKVNPSGENQLIIDATIKVSSKSKQKAEAYRDDIIIEVQERKTYIKITTDYPKERGIQSTSIDLLLTVPEQCPLDISNSFGDVEVGEIKGMKGGMTIKNNHGEIIANASEGEANLINKFGHVKVTKHQGNVLVESSNSKINTSGIKGDLVVENSFGRVTVKGVDGDVKISNSNDLVSINEVKGMLDVKNSFGEINISQVKKKALVKGSNCRIRLKNISGDTKVWNSFGDIDVESIGDNLTIDSQNSKIMVVSIKGEITIDNSFGAVNLEDIGGKITIKNPNGDISILKAKNSVMIRSNFSGITLREISGDVEVHNSNGTIIADLIDSNIDIKNNFGPVRLKKINGNVRVDNSNGSIRLRDIAVILTTREKSQQNCKKIDCSTSFGSIQLTLPKQSSIEVNARTTFGQINSDFALIIEKFDSSDSIVGKLGNGDTIINLTGKNSNIYLISE